MDDHDELRSELLEEAVGPELAKLVRTMRERQDPVASQLELVRLVNGVKGGASAWNGYTMARLAGKSRAEAISAPATGPLHDIQEFLGADGQTFTL